VIPTIDHIVNGTSKVVSQYRGRPRFLARLACYLNQVQHIEDAIFAVRNAFKLNTATGFRLDWVGAKVGQPRVGSTDEEYRLYIRARIKANRSLGKASDIQAIASLLLSEFRYWETSVAIQVETEQVLTSAQAEIIQALLQRAAGGGIPVFLVSSAGSPGFRFGLVASAATPAHGGFGSVPGSPDPSTTPGIFARVTP
jgi:hypothetical protein